MYKNYHTHTYRCKHASGTVEDYAEAALEKDVSVLGISDHTPLPDNRWPAVRMDSSEFCSYIEEIEKAREKFPQLLILKGMECEYSKEYHSFYKDEMLGRYQFDYLLTGTHYYLYEGRWYPVYSHPMNVSLLKAYADNLIKSMESGLFDFIAHPDLFANNYVSWDQNTIACSRYILEAAESFKLPIEINGYGLRKPKIITPEGIVRPGYPHEAFWELASEYDISIVVNSDAHKPEDVIASIEDCRSIAEKYSLKIADLSYLENNYRQKQP